MIDQRTAILKAADSIEAHPEWFDFMSTETPDGCGTPGCAVGWIAHYAELEPMRCIGIRKWGELGTGPAWNPCLAQDYMGVGHMGFYNLMDGLVENSNWRSNAALCAEGLRLYADKYFPAQTAEIIELRAA